jgi:hypothetical protein
MRFISLAIGPDPIQALQEFRLPIPSRLVRLGFLGLPQDRPRLSQIPKERIQQRQEQRQQDHRQAQEDRQQPPIFLSIPAHDFPSNLSRCH